MVQKKNKKILKRIGAIVCAFALAIVAFSLPFSTKKIASADEVVESTSTFIGSTYTLSIAGWLEHRQTPPGGSTSTSLYGYNGFASVSYEFETSTGGATSLTVIVSNIDIIYSSPISGVVSLSYDDTFRYNISPLSVGSHSTTFNILVKSVGGGNVIKNDYYLRFSFDYTLENSFNSKVTSFVMDSVTGSDRYWTNSRYVDNNGVMLSIGVIAHSGRYDFGGTYVPYSTRTYFLKENLSDNEYYSQGYRTGNADGYNQGYSAGESQGYSDGSTVGYNQGYSVGYNTGINEANVYSFSNLISAVIDVPVQTFMGLFNFELLGVNLADFFLSLLTVAFILALFRVFF